MSAPTLNAFLLSQESGGHNADVLATVAALADAAIKINHAIRTGSLDRAFGGSKGTVNADGDAQKELDLYADETFIEAMRHAPIRSVASEERTDPVAINAEAHIALAIDPLDGSSNIDVNVSIGTIFSLLPATGAPDTDPAAFFLQSGNRQLAAGFFIYGPQLALVLTVGSGTHVFVFSQSLGTFVQTRESLTISERTQEFATNASNYRHWDEAVRLYVDDCLKGEDGPRGKNFNMRWIASLVADAYRILMRGGIFLYPGDARPGYGNGRLRLVYEANPIALLIEQAGGRATDSVRAILDITPTSLHQRVPFVFGSAREVERISRYHTEPSTIADRAPLFGNRGLFRA
ncbi:class 1 fructose-bisphosphatase [Aminobacter carboxidus]|uniref:Fructose-1,6-bisphosphatase class 1 n=1 Tax=Aminobacter carboxidus TaxID=376165 RepID=A0ABR9GV43_9HYPH|nr:class 1 fructose-bisphosphatase [Aminobacter carboxidus]MBE1207545.1 class 1 fructose-bisphosphatase [Aminobacter carboxidus]